MNALPQSEEEFLKAMDADIGILVLVQGTLPDGTPHYAYASIPPSRYTAFKAAESKGNYDLTKFGAILAHGKGKSPPPEVQQKMIDEYGANHRFEEEISEWVENLRRLQANSTGN